MNFSTKTFPKSSGQYNKNVMYINKIDFCSSLYPKLNVVEIQAASISSLQKRRHLNEHS